MSLLLCRDCGVDVAGEPLFRQVTFAIEKGEKLGLIGPNGAGKTTLLRACLGDWPLETGKVEIKGSWGFLPQTPVLADDGNVWAAMLAERADLCELADRLRTLEEEIATNQNLYDQYAAVTERFEREGGYALEATVRKILAGLGLEQEKATPISRLSGGQKTRLALAKLLLRSPDLLVLDEPTNHLDLEALEWLEGFLSDYPAAVLVVSHDRYFLDRLVQKIVRLENGYIKTYQGNFSDHELQRALEEKSLVRETQRQVDKIARLEEYIRRNQAGVNSKQARGREKQLEKLRQTGKSSNGLTTAKGSGANGPASMSFGGALRSGDRVLDIRNLTICFGTRLLLQGVDLSLRRGERVAILGKNGTGKTSLFKAIVGQVPHGGEVGLGANVQVAYYSQEHEDLNPSGTVIDEIRGNSNLDDPEIRSLLARYGFRGEDVFKLVGVLSGGEKSRLALCKLFLTQGNLLLLDEPTNHLDAETREVLEDALLEYAGTVLAISHDRYFLDKVVTKIAFLTPRGLTLINGDYSAYREQKQELDKLGAGGLGTGAQGDVSIGDDAPAGGTPAQTQWVMAKEEQRRQKKLERMEAEIGELEKTLQSLKRQLHATDADYQKALELHQSVEEVQMRLDQAMAAWLAAVE